MKLKKSSITKSVNYILLYALYIMNGSTFYRFNHDIFLFFIFIICLVLILSKGIRIPNDIKLYLIGITAAVAFVRVLNPNGIGIGALANFTVPIIFTYVLIVLNKQEFWRRLINVIVFMSLASLLYYMASILNKSFLIRLMPFRYPILSWLDYYGGFFYVIRPQEIYRNTGVFNEPGLFQMVLNLGLFVLLFLKDRVRYTRKRYCFGLVILIAALVTTFSTSGYLGLVIIVLAYGIKRRNIHSFITIGGLGLIAVVSLLVSGLLGTGNIIADVLVTKLQNLSQVAISGGSSGSYRVAAMQIATRVIIDNPMGAGFAKLEEAMMSAGFVSYEGGTTATGAYLFRFVAVIGVVPGILTLAWIVKRYWLSCSKGIVFLTALFLFINTSLAQTDIFFTALIIPMFITTGEKRNRKLINYGKVFNHNSYI